MLPNLSGWEIILILVIALIVIGPGKLPDVGSALGKSLREFRKAATETREAVSLDAPAPRETPAVEPKAEQPAPAAAVSAPPSDASPDPSH
jgi:sec-independent protein translocase protein TatA